MSYQINRPGKKPLVSKSLRGLRDYSRKSPVLFVSAIRTTADKGTAIIGFEDGARSTVAFEDYHVMKSWIEKAKMFRGVSINSGHGM